MKKYLNNLKLGIIFGIGILMVLTISVFAYQFTDYADIGDVSSGQPLSKDMFNQLLADVRYLKNNEGESTSGPIFRVKTNTTQTFGTTDKIINWESTEIDTNNNFDLVNNRFLPTKAGKYNVNCNIYGSDLGASCLTISIYKNGIRYSGSIDRYSGTIDSVGIFSIVEMNGSTDYIDCRASDSVDTSWTLSNSVYTWFEGSYIGN